MYNKILVTTYPFDESIHDKKHGTILYNSTKRKLAPQEYKTIITGYKPNIIVAGTEVYDKDVLDLAPQLKLISRVGIGYDNINLDECIKRGITVAYTPDAPSNAVAELTLCRMLDMLRFHNNVDLVGTWHRLIGKELRNCKVGVIGCGRIGKLVIEKLQGFNPKNIYINDINISNCKINEIELDYDRDFIKTKEQILTECDIVTIHIPLNDLNYDYITKDELSLMKSDALLLNMSRGGIVNERDVYEVCKSNMQFKYAVDTFETEPYTGELWYENLPNVYLSPHLGSCTKQSRHDMENGAYQNVVRFLNKQPLKDQLI